MLSLAAVVLSRKEELQVELEKVSGQMPSSAAPPLFGRGGIEGMQSHQVWQVLPAFTDIRRKHKGEARLPQSDNAADLVYVLNV